VAIAVVEQGRPLTFSYDEVMKYHGGGSPAGVAHAWKVMERAWPLLADDGAIERREVHVGTAFGGPGARDAFECVTRAVTDDRYVVDSDLAHPELGRERQRFVFHLRYRDRAVELILREGFVTGEFVALAFKADLSPDEEATLDRLKQEMADRVMAAPADAVYDAA
jgi:hypothetical protein